MIVGKVAKAVLKLILPDVTEHLLKVFKLDKLVNYMELENSADKGIRRLKDEMDMVKGQMKDMAKGVTDLETTAIDPMEWVAFKEDYAEVKATIKKIKNMKKFKIGK